MKTKLLFTAALMAATVGTQAVPSTGSSMLVQLLESQRLENNVAVLAEGEETTVDVPTPIASYDFEEESANVTFKHFGIGVAPYSVPLSETEKGLQFTGSGNQDMGYIQIVNPFKDNTNIEANGATVSLWVYCDGTANNSIWGFGLGTDGYEDQNTSGMLGFQANTYMVYNMAKVGGPWIDFNGNPMGSNSNAIPQNQMSMITMTFASTDVTFYVNGQKVDGYAPASSLADKGSEYYPGILGYLKTHFTHFYVGKGTFTGTFSGKADKLGFYDKALTADEVKALYDSQKDAYANPVDLNAKEDVTAQYIVNADFSDAEDMYKGWTNERMPCDAERSATLGMPFMSENLGTANFDFYQVLEVPNGIYTVSVQCLSHVDTRNNYDAIRLYANDVRSIIPQNGTYGDNAVANVATTWTDNKELNRVTVANVMVDDGTLRIGISKSARKGSVCFDNFRLEKASLNDMMSAYNNLKADAEALDGARLQSDLKARLDAALADEPTDFTVDAYTEACFALQPVVDLCNAYISECPIETLIETCEAYSQNSVSTSATKATFDTAIAAAEAVDLSTVDINGLREAYNALEAARQAFVQNAVPTGEQEFDITFMLTNPEVSNLAVGYQNGWYCDINKINFVVADNPNQAGETGFNKFFECFEWNSLGTGWAIYQKATVPQGSYKMTVAAFAARSSNASTAVDATTPKLALYVGDTRGTEVTSTVLSYGSVEFIQTETQEVYLGVKVEDGNQINWCGLNDMKLYKVHQEATDLSLNETDVAYEVAAGTFANVTLTRTLKSDDKWNTFCVPFDMTAEQLAANGITDVRALESASVEGTSVTLNFSESNLNAVEAGVPYLVKVDASYDGTINVENVLVSAAEPTTVSVEGGVSMTGNYAAGNVPTGAYFISDNAFYYADEANYVSLKGFRAYINVNGTSEAAGANRLMINLDGEVTGIEDVLGEEAAEADKLVNVVSLDGMTVKAGVKKSEALDGLQKGIYIVDGKKYVVK